MYFQERLLKFKIFDWLSYFKAHFVVITFSIIIGVSSHILWDSFTHECGFFVEKLALLSHTFYIDKTNVPVYKLLQDGSSMVGIILILFIIIQLPAEKINKNNHPPQYWLLVVALSGLFFWAKIYIGFRNKAI